MSAAMSNGCLPSKFLMACVAGLEAEAACSTTCYVITMCMICKLSSTYASASNHICVKDSMVSKHPLILLKTSIL